ncbi:hypothetical protein FB45DRAFT_867420 [Roridomyces roridus]|uniref:Uncharacterized protein n=1 Tax=Roridomyces roridus TaxID=1738132 RepID=A0AAD7BQS3_9AGAR|nr:hypothetical protein FB45DRAFT_867420 [Roridomyces roridus]
MFTVKNGALGRRQRASYLDEEVGEDGEDGKWCGRHRKVSARSQYTQDAKATVTQPLLQKKRQKALKQLQTRTLWSLTVDCPGDTELVQELRAALAAARRSNSGTDSHDNDEEDSNQTVFRGALSQPVTFAFPPSLDRQGSLPELTPDGSEAGVALRDPAPVAFFEFHSVQARNSRPFGVKKPSEFHYLRGPQWFSSLSTFSSYPAVSPMLFHVCVGDTFCIRCAFATGSLLIWKPLKFQQSDLITRQAGLDAVVDNLGMVFEYI